jgi:hypothetical protein
MLRIYGTTPFDHYRDLRHCCVYQLHLAPTNGSARRMLPHTQAANQTTHERYVLVEHNCDETTMGVPHQIATEVK